MTIILILCIPITALVVGFLVLKGVQLGLRWQLEVRQERPPTMETPKNPIQVVQQAKQETEVKSLIDEWVNGVEKP